MNHRILGLTALIAVFSALALPARAADIRERRPSPLGGVTALDKPVTYTETKIPLGELLQRVAAATGVKLTASREVADEPVAVVVEELPARELLEQLADLLDYVWSKRGKEGEWRYEIWQDVAAKQREAALREATVREAEQELREQIRARADVAVLPDAEFERLAAEAKRRAHDSPPREEPGGALAAAERARNARYEAALALQSPVARALALLLGRLSPQQWARLREPGWTLFSTRPDGHELRLPLDIEQRLHAALPVSTGEHPYYSPEQQAEDRSRFAALVEVWKAAPDFRVALQLDTRSLRTQGTQLLHVSVYPFRVGEPLDLPSSSYTDGTSLVISTTRVEERQVIPAPTADQLDAWMKDPVLGTARPFVPRPKRKVAPDYADDPSESRLRDLLPELAQAYGVNFISDAYWSCNPILTGLSPSSPKPLYYLLSAALPTPQRWDRRGRLIRLRDRNWFLDRPREVPLRLVHAWRDRISRDGALPLASFAEMASTLTDLQLDSLGSLVHDAGLPLDFPRAADSRFALRLWAALRSDQQQALRRAVAVPVARLTPDARVLLVRALARKMEVPAAEIDREQLASGRLEADVTFLLREVRNDTGQLTVEDHSVWGATDGKSEPHSPTPVGGPVAPGPLRRRVADVIFICRYGKEESEIGSVIVSTGD